MEMEPIPGLPTVLWDPYNPVIHTITGQVHRCESTVLIRLKEALKCE